MPTKMGIRLRYAEKSFATSDTTPMKMSATVAVETSGRKPTKRPRYKTNASECSHNGTYACGICQCDERHFGQKCECSATQLDSLESYASNCKPNNDSDIPDCFGQGICFCGECKCNLREDEDERIYGKYCQCDNFSCARVGGQLCAGRGVCDCGQCVCRPGWSGADCNCKTATDSCVAPGDSAICSDNGYCDCGVCRCEEEFEGTFCERPVTGSLTRMECERLLPCVLCRVHKREPLSPLECAVNCTSLIIVKVDSLEEGENCVMYTEDNCRCEFFYSYNDTSIIVQALKTLDCPVKLGYYPLIAIVGLVFLVGLFALALWKLYVVRKDRIEFAKFEDEQKKARWEAVKTSIIISKICILNSKFVPGCAGNKVQDKLEQVLQRNVGLKDLRTASDILAGKNTDLQCNIPVQLVSKFKYAPVQSILSEKLLSSSLLSKNLKVRIYKTVTLPVVLYGCETWTLTLREEHRLRVFENKVLRKIFGAKRDEVTGEWRKLHNTELHSLYSSPDIIRNIKSRRLRWAGHVAREIDGVCVCDIPLFKYARLTSCDVERSFSQYKSFGINRHAFVMENLEMTFVVHCNSRPTTSCQLSEDRSESHKCYQGGTTYEATRPGDNGCAVSSTQKFLVQQHITTSKHQANKQLNSKQRQLFLTQPTTSNVRSEFNIDLCRSLISADIPLYKLKNKVFREFLEKYTQHTIPDESTLRKTYAPSIYDETIQKIRDEIKDSSIWVSIDET
ncbi:hypothetical protein ANN_07247 [Periplaneta americana]|uniref:Integrin beta subunit tail domain-containing protein n=1 Tax=Periplaneta americana TaxID=6978 RepID=A0ABQ8TI60_PERAM|nr:hypothetical protein ANN_07247 [Periplaneta americana]